MRELRIGRDDLRRHLPAAALVAISAVVALALRATLVSGTNEDVEVFREWLDALRAEGLGGDISTYPPVWSYLVLVSDAVLGAARDTLVLKAPAIAADLIGAAYAYRIVRLRYPTGLAPAFAFATIMLAPTVVVNSAYWGQIDMLWAAPLVASVYYVLRERPLAAFVALGIGLAVKQQALFLVPFLVVLAARRVVPWRHFLVLPAIYVLSVIPSFVAGRSLRELLEIYPSQAHQFEQLSLHAATVYAFVPTDLSAELGRAATIWSLAALGLVTLAAVIAPLDVRSIEGKVGLATASVLVTPLILPHMHDRYFFAADLLTIVLAFLVPRLAPIALAVQLVSFVSGTYFLGGEDLLPIEVLALIQLATATVLVGWLVRRGQSAGGPSGGGRLRS